jgi:RNA polymerase sigma-70 factor, ECF subfamily
MTRNAFNDIIHKTYRKLYIIAFRILGNQQEAEDIVQEVFMKMWMMKGKLDDYKDTEALAVTMARNSSIDLLRKRKRIENYSRRSEISVTELSPSPFELMANSEAVSVLRAIIEKLPPDYREIIILKEINGFSYEEIEGITSININSLRVKISRARQMIREKYIQYSYERGTT